MKPKLLNIKDGDLQLITELAGEEDAEIDTQCLSVNSSKFAGITMGGDSFDNVQDFPDYEAAFEFNEGFDEDDVIDD